ncbi:tyrosine aminotransferase-like isoform X2 [Convolutriloba macropyga]|uniref:tyrosine aminotransferase-like isoform X2 n=1 Tax=Convolutriloba macropyga TaxID=536237 RepID=UPI003F51FAE7
MQGKPSVDYQIRKFPASERSLNTVNLLRNIVDALKIDKDATKSFIPLSIGDPTTFGNFPISEGAKRSLIEAIEGGNCHGYGPSIGFPFARKAVADFHSSRHVHLTENDVLLTPSCSSALDLAIGAIAEEKSNILLPSPGFPLYETLTGLYNVNVKYYNLLPEKNWEVDLNQLESVIDSNTSAIVVCNPSNPCGSVFSPKHIRDIIQTAEDHNLPIIADEVYSHMVFNNVEFESFGDLSENVPVLVTGGLAKRWLAPGWRVGWIILHDRHDQLSSVREGLINLSQRILHPNTICQFAIPGILRDTPPEFFKSVMADIEENAKLAFSKLAACPSLKPVMPEGAMYMMTGVDVDTLWDQPDDVAFTQNLLKYQNVFCLPGSGFTYPNSFRIVLTVPRDVLSEACDRIVEFCNMNLKQ